MINLDAKRQLDVAAIASHVGQALEPAATPVQPEPLLANSPLPMLDELSRQVRQLVAELERCRSLQQRLEQQLTALGQQVHLLPAHIVRLEQWSVGVDLRLTTLEIPVAQPNGSEPQAGCWLSVKEVARQLGVKEDTIRRYVHEGKVQATRLPGGRRLRVYWPDGCACQAAEAGPRPQNLREPGKEPPAGRESPPWSCSSRIHMPPGKELRCQLIALLCPSPSRLQSSRAAVRPSSACR